jgi:hypothetical protein
MSLHTLVNISYCVTCVNFEVCVLSNIQYINVCVHCTAIKRLPELYLASG